MQLNGAAKRVCIYIGESDQWNHQQLANAIVERCRKEGLAGATVFRGLIGYGANSRIRSTHILDLSTDLPLLIEIIDSPENIERILPILEEMVKEGLITQEDIHVIKYVHSNK